MFVNKMSQMIVRESSDSVTSDDNDLEDKQMNDILYAQKMINSKGKVDLRLLNLYKLRKADKTKDFIELDDLESAVLKNPEKKRRNAVIFNPAMLSQI